MEEALTNTLATAAPVVQAAVPGADIPTWFVVVLGMVIVFIGLICLIALISFMGAIMKKVNAKHETAAEAAAPSPWPKSWARMSRRSVFTASKGYKERKEAILHEKVSCKRKRHSV